MECAVVGCEDPSSAKDLCRKHYMRQRRRGSTAARTVLDRLWAMVDFSAPSGCWPWTGDTSPGGYGMIQVDGRHRLANRVLWEELHPEDAPLPRDILIRHTCDNPPCSRPDHHLKGSAADNSADMTSRGRQARGERIGRAVLDEQRVAEIRRRYAEGGVRQVDLAEEFGVSQSQISYVVRGKFWRTT